jgi:hypothetical protein
MALDGHKHPRQSPQFRRSVCSRPGLNLRSIPLRSVRFAWTQTARAAISCCMRKRCLRGATVIAILQLGAGLACGHGESGASEELNGPGVVQTTTEGNTVGQTGSTDSEPICVPGEDEFRCQVETANWSRPIGRATLMGSKCVYGPTAEVLPICECTLRTTGIVNGDGTGEETAEIVTYPGLRPGSCSVYARTPSECLYCGTEFSGCSIDSPQSCDAICSDLAQRYDGEMQRSFAINSRVARCGEDFTCEYVTEIEGVCYARNPTESEIPGFDCALSDEQILASSGVNFAPTCPERAISVCDSSSDCPGGLACDASGQCGTCTSQCVVSTDGSIQCPESPACLAGEVCVSGYCLPSANVSCAVGLDCGEGRCVVSGIDPNEGRGNASARSLCTAP